MIDLSAEDVLGFLLLFGTLTFLSYRFFAMRVFKTMRWIIVEGEVDSVRLLKGTWSHVSVIRFVDGSVMRLRGDYRRVCSAGSTVRITRRVVGGYDVRTLEAPKLAQ